MRTHTPRTGARQARHAGAPRRAAAGLAAALTLTLAACAADDADDTADGPDGDGSGTGGGTLTVVTHDSFALSQELLDRFEEESGYDVTYAAPGDAGTLVNQLVLTKGSPIGDVVYGIDTTFAGRALAEDVLAEYRPEALDAQAVEQFAADDSGRLTPVDYGDVCLNADLAWFEENGQAMPETLEDLTDPAYRDLLVVSNPATSSPGLSFLAATVAEFGEDGYLDYWTRLSDNGLLVARDWTEAYSVQFSGSAGEGPRPLVLSYSTSPAFEVVDGAARTTSLLGTCFRQVEYAGVVAGTQNEAGARAFVDFLLTPEVQADIPGQMFMYPVRPDVEMPAEWVEFAPLSDDPHTLAPAEISEGREQWIRDWTDTVLG